MRFLLSLSVSLASRSEAWLGFGLVPAPLAVARLILPADGGVLSPCQGPQWARKAHRPAKETASEGSLTEPRFPAIPCRVTNSSKTRCLEQQLALILLLVLRFGEVFVGTARLCSVSVHPSVSTGGSAGAGSATFDGPFTWLASWVWPPADTPTPSMKTPRCEQEGGAARPFPGETLGPARLLSSPGDPHPSCPAIGWHQFRSASSQAPNYWQSYFPPGKCLPSL